MSRWFWALLAGVVLVAIAAVVWIDQTSVLPPVLPRARPALSIAGSARRQAGGFRRIGRRRSSGSLASVT